MDEFEVRFGETDLAIEIMREVAQWCMDVGWPIWNLDELTREKLLRYPPAEDDFRVAWLRGKPAASMILQWHDPDFWPDLKENESGFIHKLCVRRDFAGRNLSKKMVVHAASECKKRGIGYLRLDTDWGSPKLCGLYESLGFVKVGRRFLGGQDYALYELKLTDIQMR